MSQNNSANVSHSDQVLYEVYDKIATITLNRPEKLNAMSQSLLDDLEGAFDRAKDDSSANVVLLKGAGRSFCAGYDLAPDDWILTQYGADFDGPVNAVQDREDVTKILEYWLRLWKFPKPIIAEVQGKVIAGGLMLVWVCDMIIASDDASFADPVVAFGVNGVEYFAHPWEVGVRKAKEMLFTGEPVSAEEAKSLGMVNHVVPRDELTQFTTDMAEHIAERPSMGLKLAKQSVNQMQDSQGLWPALQAAMSLQQLGHANNYQIHNMAVDPKGAEIIMAQAKKK